MKQFTTPFRPRLSSSTLSQFFKLLLTSRISKGEHSEFSYSSSIKTFKNEANKRAQSSFLTADRAGPSRPPKQLSKQSRKFSCLKNENMTEMQIFDLLVVFDMSTE